MEISFFVQSIRRMAFTSAKHGGCLVGSFDGCLCCVDSFQVGSLHETGAKVRFFKTKNGGQGVIQMPAIFFLRGGDENLMLNFEGLSLAWVWQI